MGEDNLTVAFAALLEGSYVTDMFNFMEFYGKDTQKAAVISKLAYYQVPIQSNVWYLVFM